MQPQVAIFQQHRIRLVRQTELAECGLACLAMIAEFHGLKTDLAALRREFQPSLRGVSLRSLMNVADQLGFATRPVKLALERLEQLTLPAILHWNFNHFVVLEKVSGNDALIHNPEGLSRWMPLREISHHFTGIAVEIYASDNLQAPRKLGRLRLNDLWSRAVGFKRAAGQALVLSAILEIYVLSLPYYTQVVVDNALPAFDRHLITTLAVGFGLFLIVQAGASLLRSFVLLSAGASLAYGVALNFSRKLFRLPIAWFEKRHVGDILSRFQSIEPIRLFLTDGAIAALLDGLLATTAIIIMLFYSTKLAALALIALLMILAVRMSLFRAQREAQEDVLIRSGKENSVMIESLRGMTTIRLFNREMARRARWQERLTDATNANIRLGRITLWQSVITAFILGFEYIISIWLSSHMVLNGGFSLGMMFAFLSYKTLFLQRGTSLLDQVVAARILGLHLERLSDVALADEDVAFAEYQTGTKDLNGRIELRNVSFRYSPSDPRILKDINLVVEPGDHIALTGPSGCGKSTLAKLILGLIEPDEGEILIDEEPLINFGHREFREQAGAVLQDDHLFSGSLRDNIALFDEDIDMEKVRAAAAMAAIDADIAMMPMQYDTLVGDMGSTLSGGQRQRLLLARALYKKPKLLLMDEGTSHLDVQTEKAVNASVSQLGITRIIIAHRRETILAAAKVYRLIEGRLELLDQGNLDDCPMPPPYPGAVAH